MQVMVLDEEPLHAAHLARALMARGLQVICVDSIAAAEALVRLGLFDLLILAERVQGHLSHRIALMADCGGRSIPSVIVTDRQGDDVAELFELIPSVYAVMGRDTQPAMVAKIAVAALVAMPAAHRVIPPDAPTIEDEGLQEVTVVPVTVPAPAPVPVPGVAQGAAPVAVAAPLPAPAPGPAPVPMPWAAPAPVPMPAPATAPLSAWFPDRVGVLSPRIDDRPAARSRAELAALLAELPPPRRALAIA
ncbi:MAG: response regulator [Rubellimicrobium sp.]|nr:response regulator [Rubellimicrobium sp.]